MSWPSPEPSPEMLGAAGEQIIQLPRIPDARGNLYDVPGGAARAGHALRSCHQFIVSLSGSFDVTLDDGRKRRRFPLNRAYYGLYVPPLVWREIDNFSANAVCLVLASTPYDADDYIRDYPDFVATVRPASAAGASGP